MNSLIETDDWKLGCFMEWRAKPKVVECSYCNGSGEIGGGFKDIDGPRTCPECFGSKVKRVHPTSKQPEIPEDLREHMRRAWFDFVHAHKEKQSNSIDTL